MRESRLLHALEDPVDAERERQADAGELVLHDERVDPGLESPLRGFEEKVSPRKRVAVHRDAIEHDLFPRYGEKTEPLLAGAPRDCLLYTSDAADDLLCVDLGGRRI